MPPKRRQYRKPKVKEPVVFGPEPPPPPQPAAPVAPPPLPSERGGARQQAPDIEGESQDFQSTPTATEDASRTTEPQQEEEGEVMTVEIGGKGNKRRKRFPRKKWGKETKGGWEGDDELPPHADDEGRYDPAVPYDLRLLRCCDEFRSLRSFRDKDIRVNYNTLLRFFQADIPTLRASYGSQVLRGYDPEADQEDNEVDEDDEAGSDADDDPLQEKKVSLEGKTEEEWAGYVFDPGRLVKFFDNRFNDGYTPTLTLAPKIAASFFKFQLARNVFPDCIDAIKACIEVCEMASKQLHPAAILLKQLKNHDGLALSVSRLFRPGSAAQDQAFSLPIPCLPDPAFLSTEEASHTVHSVYEISQKELPEIEARTEKVEPHPVKDWAEWKKQEGRKAKEQELENRGGGGRRKDEGKDPSAQAAEEDAHEETARLARVKKQFELDASARRKWSSRARSASSAASQLVASVQQLGLVGEQDEGAWMLGKRERSARTFKGWELVSGMPAAPEPKGMEAKKAKDGEKKPNQGDDRLLVRLMFGKHEEAFPLTAQEHPAPPSSLERIDKANFPADNHDLSDSLVEIIDLPSFFNLDHLTTLSQALFEADYTQLVFVPSSTSPTAPARPLPTMWTFSPLHHIIPPYWTHTTELLREEPKEVERCEWGADGDDENDGVGEGKEGGKGGVRGAIEGEVRERWRVEEERIALAEKERADERGKEDGKVQKEGEKGEKADCVSEGEGCAKGVVTGARC
ncbi:hypothetical protein JCM11251_003052 [Rhodosporidiobolus azoricus]